MHTLRLNPSISRFTTVAALARNVANAPLNAKGQPCVFAGVERDETGEQYLVAKTLDATLNTRLALAEVNTEMVKSCETYLVQRLKTLGFHVVGSASQLSFN